MAKRRGFETIEEHDNHIIECWNSTVHKKDTVWILGDITMEKKEPYKLLSKLNGIKNVVLGNHDLPQHTEELLKYTNKICGSFEYKGCILTHIPIHKSEMKRYRLNIHGHLHLTDIGGDRYINVSCEKVGYKPVLLNDIIRYYTMDRKQLYSLKGKLRYEYDVKFGKPTNELEMAKRRNFANNKDNIERKLKESEYKKTNDYKLKCRKKYRESVKRCFKKWKESNPEDYKKSVNRHRNDPNTKIKMTARSCLYGIYNYKFGKPTTERQRLDRLNYVHLRLDDKINQLKNANTKK